MQEFAIPKPRKKVKTQEYRPQQKTIELDQQASKIIQNQKQFTSQQIYRTHARLEDAIITNQDQRMKYQVEPQKFFESQLAINQILTRLSSISAYPDLIPDFIASNMMKLLMMLLEHQNQNILGQNIQVICQFITIQIQDDDLYQKHLRYCLSLAQKKFFKLLLKNIQKLDENKVEQYQIVYKILRIVEQMLDFSDSIANIVVDQSDIMRYLADRIMPNYKVSWKLIDDNKYISSEILIQLLQNSPQNRFTFSKFQGMEVLLQSIAVYRKGMPDNEDQKEFLKNLFALVCILLCDLNGKQEFTKLEGVKLMIIFVKSKTMVSKSALKVISYGLQPESCSLLIKQSGLKYIFPIMMRQGVKQKDIEEQKSIDQHCLNIIKQLIINTKGMDFDRVINKFKEKNFQKLLRLIQLRVQYSDLIHQQIEITQDKYIQKLSEGLTVLELVDIIIIQLSSKNKQLKVNLKQMIKQFNIQPSKIKKVIQRYASQLQQSNPYKQEIIVMMEQWQKYIII